MSSNAYTVNIVNAEELYVAGDKISGFRLGAVKEDGSNVGLNTNFPKLQLDISGTGAIRIPAGTTADRSSIKNSLISGSSTAGIATDLLGVLRYNKTTSRYEAIYEHTLPINNNEPKWGNFVMEDSNGNVGISTNDPSYNLHINGTISDPYLKNPSNVSPTWYGSLHCGTDISGITMGRCTRNGQNISTAHYNGIQSHSFGLGTSLTINPFGGNVGIGTTSPRCSLNITNTILVGQGTIPEFTGDINDNSTCSLFLGKSVGTKQNYWGMWMGTIYETNGSNYGSYIQSGSDTNHYPILLNPNGGNVGIGTTSPDRKFEMKQQLGTVGFYSNYAWSDGNYNNLDTGFVFNITGNGSQSVSIPGDSYILKKLTGFYIDAYDTLRLNASTPAHNVRICEGGGNVSIGPNENNDYKLYVLGPTWLNGQVSCAYNSSFNAWGTSRFKWPDHGGGWYMQDSSWIRSDGDKALYIHRSSESSTGIATTGRVGIGTSTPSMRLTVKAQNREISIGDTGSHNIGQIICHSTGNPSSIAYLRIRAESIQFYTYTNNRSIYIEKGDEINSTNHLYLQYSNNRNVYLCSGGGDVFVNRSIQITSDDRLKHNEIVIDNALETINKLTAKKYFKTQEMYEPDKNFDFDAFGNLIDDDGNKLKYRIETGFIAQEVQKISELKYLVKNCDEGKDIFEDKKDENGNIIYEKDGSGNNTEIPEQVSVGKKKMPLTLNYQDIFVLNVQATQEIDRELQADKLRIAASEAKIAALEAENTALKARLDAIEAKLILLEKV